MGRFNGRDGAGRGGEKDKADQGGAAIDGGGHGSVCAKSAYFDLDGHGAVVAAAISVATFRAASAGSEAPVMGRPMTR